jgi:hypothetical protein
MNVREQHMEVVRWRNMVKELLHLGLSAQPVSSENGFPISQVGALHQNCAMWPGFLRDSPLGVDGPVECGGGFKEATSLLLWLLDSGGQTAAMCMGSRKTDLIEREKPDMQKSCPTPQRQQLHSFPIGAAWSQRLLTPTLAILFHKTLLNPYTTCSSCLTRSSSFLLTILIILTNQEVFMSNEEV